MNFTGHVQATWDKWQEEGLESLSRVELFEMYKYFERLASLTVLLDKYKELTGPAVEACDQIRREAKTRKREEKNHLLWLFDNT